MTEKERNWLRFNLQCHSICQFMHGEQGALIATSKIVATVPDMNAKFYAATQVMDEARHVESYKRLIHEKFKCAYPITKSLQNLLEQTLTDRRWDMTYLGMQVMIEGLALAAFQRIRDTSKNNLAASVNAYVMLDEARHVTFGRMALREYYPQLSDHERGEREEFAVEALYFMREVLEGAAAALAARHASDAQIEVLERLLDDEAALPESDSAMHAEINKQFHAAIYRAAHNRYVLRSLQSMQDAIQRLQTTTFSWPGRPAKALREHRAIMRAITKRDPGAAEQAARAHMREALRYRMLLRHKRS